MICPCSIMVIALPAMKPRPLLTDKTLIRITTVPIALAYPLRGQPAYMKSRGMNVVLISSDGKELPLVVAREKCAHLIVPMTREITPFKDLKALWMLWRIFRKYKPDIVHTETPKAGFLGMLAAWLAGVTHRIHTVAGLPLMVQTGLKLWLLSLIEKITYAAATHVWPNSESLKNYIEEHHLCASRKLKVVGKGSSNGINLHRFNIDAVSAAEKAEVAKRIHYDAANTYLLFVGRMVYDKGIVELVHVFLRLYKDNPFLRLILAGQYERSLDPLPADIETAIQSHEAIVHIPWTSKVEHLMALSDFFVFPSYREGFPNVLLEAGAMQLPVVCSAIAGNVDIITHRHTGLLFKAQNEIELQEQLSWALAHRQEARHMAKLLHDGLIQEYAREQFWATMYKEYAAILEIA